MYCKDNNVNGRWYSGTDIIRYPFKIIHHELGIKKCRFYDLRGSYATRVLRNGAEISEGKYIVVVLVFIQNSEGKFLIQKRSKRKNGKFATTGGHPKSGESSIQGIITEVQEEIGLKLNPDDLKLYFSGKSEEERVFWDDYYIKIDIQDIKQLKLQEDEVSSIEWLSENEIVNLMKQDKFFKNHYEEFEILLRCLNNG